MCISDALEWPADKPVIVPVGYQVIRSDNTSSLTADCLNAHEQISGKLVQSEHLPALHR